LTEFEDCRSQEPLQGVVRFKIPAYLVDALPKPRLWAGSRRGSVSQSCRWRVSGCMALCTSSAKPGTSADLAHRHDDEALAAECREWYEAYGQAVYSNLRFHVSSADTAEDLTAETFLKAIRSLEQFDSSKGSPRAWIFKIAENTLRDHLRRTRIRQHISLSHLRDLATEAPSPEEHLLWEEQRLDSTRDAAVFAWTCRRRSALERNHRKVRWNAKIHLPEGPIPSLGGEDMMSHCLDVPKATFQRAGSSKRSRSRNATSELHGLYRAAHRVGYCKQ